MQNIQQQLPLDESEARPEAQPKQPHAEETPASQESPESWRKSSGIVQQRGSRTLRYKFPLVPGESARQRRKRLLRENKRAVARARGSRFVRPKDQPITVEFIKSQCTVDESTGCWNWNRAKTPTGYGVIRIPFGTSAYSVHRAAWEATNGTITGRLCVCHKCDNRKWCNPDHLFLGTHKDNTQDAVRKGRHGIMRRNHERQLLST